MKIATQNGRQFQVSFRNSNKGHEFTISNGNISSTHKIKYATSWSVTRSLAKKFNLPKSDVYNLKNGLIDHVLSFYSEWHKERL